MYQYVVAGLPWNQFLHTCVSGAALYSDSSTVTAVHLSNDGRPYYGRQTHYFFTHDDEFFCLYK